MGQEQKPVIIHLHVPKCAGVSVNRALADHFRPRAISPSHRRNSNNRERFLAMSKEERDERYDCVFGHLVYGEHRRFTRPCYYISAIRDPVERICSFFNFLHTRPDHHLHAYMKEALCDLNDIDERHLEDGRLANQWSDAFVRVYGGGRKLKRILKDVEEGRMMIGPLDTMKEFLAAIGVYEIGHANITDVSGAVDFAPASLTTLTPRAREFLEDNFCRADYDLLDTLEHRGWPNGAEFASQAGLSAAWA